MTAMWNSYLAVMAGGAQGSAARMWKSMSQASKYEKAFPVGTLAVNELGCLLIGVFKAVTPK